MAYADSNPGPFNTKITYFRNANINSVNRVKVVPKDASGAIIDLTLYDTVATAYLTVPGNPLNKLQDISSGMTVPTHDATGAVIEFGSGALSLANANAMGQTGSNYNMVIELSQSGTPANKIIAGVGSVTVAVNT
jgi:hypothetical protein